MAASQSAGQLEKHVQTIVGGLVLAGLLWVGNAVTESRTHIATLKEQVNQLQAVVGDRYTGKDAKRDLELIDLKLENLKMQISGNKDGIQAIQDHLQGGYQHGNFERGPGNKTAYP